MEGFEVSDFKLNFKAVKPSNQIGKIKILFVFFCFVCLGAIAGDTQSLLLTFYLGITPGFAQLTI